MKSFRAAADRLVRQESSSSADVLRLIGSAVEPARAITNEHEEWDARLAALEAIGEYDGLAVVASGPLRITHARNVSDPRALQRAVAEAIDEVGRRGTAAQLRAPVVLEDGRPCSEIMVAPLRAIEGVDGALVALRVGRGFTATDAVTASRVGTLLSLELRRAAAAAQDSGTVRQSLALFELARIGLGHEELGERLLGMVDVVARSLGHDVAQLWLLRGGGSLRLRAAHPRQSLVLEIARPRDHTGLARALDGETVQGNDPSLRSWIRRTTRELIIAPLRGEAGVSGLLALGRFSDRYVDDDLKMATQCATFVANIVGLDALARRGRTAAPREDTEWEAAEDSLTGS